MGDRNYIVIESDDFESDIAIYSHNGSTSNVDIVRDVLSSSDRIGDPSYLVAQIIHRAFQEAGYSGGIGMGISSLAKGSFPEHWGDNPTVYVNADTGRWSVGDDQFNRWGQQLNQKDED